VHKTSEESKAINELNGPLIIISASGMATGGRVLHHLKQRLPDATNMALFCGYQAEGTRGRTLQDGAREIKTLGQLVPVRAQIKMIDGFSAHADQAEILRWLGAFERPSRTTYIVHGEWPASAALADVISNRLKWPVAMARLNQIISLD
jgi:metallo-beta-lactamase family protein